jgi:hypothetical protein
LNSQPLASSIIYTFYAAHLTTLDIPLSHIRQIRIIQQPVFTIPFDQEFNHNFVCLCSFISCIENNHKLCGKRVSISHERQPFSNFCVEHHALADTQNDVDASEIPEMTLPNTNREVPRICSGFCQECYLDCYHPFAHEGRCICRACDNRIVDDLNDGSIEHNNPNQRDEVLPNSHETINSSRFPSAAPNHSQENMPISPTLPFHAHYPTAQGQNNCCQLHENHFQRTNFIIKRNRTSPCLCMSIPFVQATVRDNDNLWLLREATQDFAPEKLQVAFTNDM